MAHSQQDLTHRDPFADAEAFVRDGYLVVPAMASSAALAAMTGAAKEALDPLTGPVEFEADVGYPGAPLPGQAGDATPRRLLHAYARHSSFRDWSTSPVVAKVVAGLLGDARILLSQCHHNCVMTKHPGHSSATLWHQDVRYWSFTRPELVSLWLALGPETPANGALQVIPGSHRLELDPSRLDEELFLRPELPANQRLIAKAQPVRLQPGDALFFSGRLFHAAGRNETDEVKLSVVTTYHGADNLPVPGTRSARYPSIEL